MPALRETLVEHMSSLRRYALALIGSRLEADELVQECFVRALASRHCWKTLPNPRAYLFSILHNAYVDRVRRAGSPRQTVCLDDCGVVPTCAPPQARRLELMDLERALRRLPDEQREVVLLVGLEEMPYDEVSEILRIPVGTVMSRLSRGRAALRRMTEQ